jgi:hypothetical protein
VPPDLARHIASLNRTDMALHAEASQLFEAMCREHGLD